MYSGKSLHDGPTASVETIEQNMADQLAFNSSALESIKRARRYAYLWFCVEFNVINGDYFVTKADKTWGKWVTKPYGIETQSPEGRRLATNENTLICSSGRDSSPSGTEVLLEIIEAKSRAPWKIYWNMPLSGSTTFTWQDYDSGIQVERVERERDWHIFTVRRSH